MPIFELPDAQTLHYREVGSGPPLVLLHGGYGSWMHWIRNVGPLARQFTVIAPDMPGLGDSATPPEPWTPTAAGCVTSSSSRPSPTISSPRGP